MDDGVHDQHVVDHRSPLLARILTNKTKAPGRERTPEGRLLGRNTLTRLAFFLLLLAVAGASAAQAPRPSVERFDGQAAFAFLKRQVALGPRPAGSAASRKLAALLRASIPNGSYQAVPDGLRNVIGTVRGRDPNRIVVVGAHYDTKDLPGFVGANDSASGTAVVRQLARTIKPGTLRPTLVFIFFDGEESPRESQDFERDGLRGSKVAARGLAHAEAMVLLDFVGDRDLAIPREAQSSKRLWAKLRAAAKRVGVGSVFPPRSQGVILDDHLPFLRTGVPAIDLIDFDFPCFHRRCDNLSVVSERSVDAVGETMIEFLRSF
jgi:glutaminyl-peptide cyclotransferase